MRGEGEGKSNTGTVYGFLTKRRTVMPTHALDELVSFFLDYYSNLFLCCSKDFGRSKPLEFWLTQITLRRNPS